MADGASSTCPADPGPTARAHGAATPTRATRRNKRKMSEPRRRADVPKKRLVVNDASSDDDDDDDGRQRARQPTPETSPSSDERNNSTGSGYSPAPILLPGAPSQLLPGGLGAILPTPVIAQVGGLPQYAVLPGIAPAYRAGLFPPPPLAPPGFPPAADATSGASSERLRKTPDVDVDANHNCVRPADGQRTSPTGSQYSAPPTPPSVGSAYDARAASRKQRKNYKNMTRERRVEANARERTRVHTISAAFESLRRAVPSYSYHQRLSKLAILRIACSYILALSRLADDDYADDGDGLSFSECVDLCTQTIQSEGRAKRRH